jgi:hypothetical protein
VEVNIIIIIIIIIIIYLKQKIVPMFITKIYGGVETKIHSLLISTLRKNGQLQTPVALFQGKESSEPMTQDAERNPNPAWTLWKKSLSLPPEIETCLLGFPSRNIVPRN